MSNKWLENPDFLDKISFKDKYYLESLFHKISAFIKNAPVPILASYDSKNKSIYLTIGDNKQYFPLNTDIAYYDMITLMKRWCSQFYPQYEVEIEKQIEYTDEEIVNDLVAKKGMNLNDALLARKPIQYIEKGIIEKVYFGDNDNRDKFILNINGKRHLRLTGNITKGIIMPISDFMSGIRKLSKDQCVSQNIKEYIELNSIFIRELKDENDILITYRGKQMLSFIEINFPDLFPEYDLTQMPNDDFTFVWGKFKLIFDSKILIQDALSKYNKLITKMYLKG